MILSSITLIYGGLLLVSGLTALRNPAAAARFPMTRPLPPNEEAITSELMSVNADIVTRHAAGIRGRAAASTVLALLMLYSAAAALSRDRHGRAATLLAAWLGIAYQVGSLPVMIPIAREYAVASVPILQRMASIEMATPAGDAGAAAGGGANDAGAAAGAGTASSTPADPPGEPLKPEAMNQFVYTVFLGIPIATALLGVLGSLLLISYFGGRRGRALYGLGPAPPRT